MIVAGDIDRGGVFASLYGTVALLSDLDQAQVAAFVINKFRGDLGLLQPGIDALTTMTGRPTLGVLPWHPDLWIDAEDSLSYADGRVIGRPEPPRGSQWLRVAAVRLPHISNATDLEALAAESGVSVRLTTSVAELADADLVVLPGSKSTVDDLAWLRSTGLAAAIVDHARSGRPVLGICGGFQMLARSIDDDVESGRGRVDGLGLLPIEITFHPEKTLRHAAGAAYGVAVRGYEIHHGQVSAADATLEPLIVRTDGAGEGARSAGIFGPHWHGAFESDAFRRAFLEEAARSSGRAGFVVAPDTAYADRRTRMLDLLGDLVEEHLDTEQLLASDRARSAARLPFLPPGAPSTAIDRWNWRR